MFSKNALKIGFKLEGMESSDWGTHSDGWKVYNTNTHGSLIDCQYWLEVDVSYDGCHCYERDPLVKIPLIVLNPKICSDKPNLGLVAEGEWNPWVSVPYIAMLTPGFMGKQLQLSFHDDPSTIPDKNMEALVKEY